MPSVGDPESELTRKQRHERWRAERRELEAVQSEAAARGRRRMQLASVLIVVVVVGVIVALVASSGASKKAGPAAASEGSGGEAGLRATPAPWPAEYEGLLKRIVGHHFPPQTDMTSGYHIHAVLQVWVDGKQVPVPGKAGIDEQESFLSPLHTHDTSGVIHMEATEPYSFTLGQFFDVWGVKFTAGQIGAYRAGNGNVLAVYTDGQRVADPVSYVMKPHDRIVVDFGDPKGFVKDFSFSWPAGL